MTVKGVGGQLIRRRPELRDCADRRQSTVRIFALRMWILPDVSVRNLDYTTKGGFYVSQISGDTDENLNTAFFTVSLSSAPSSDNVTITMATSDHGRRCDQQCHGRRNDNDDNAFIADVHLVELELGADGDGDRCGGQLIRRRPGYAIVLTGDNDSRICALRMWIPRMFRCETSITRPKAASTFLRSQETPMRT